MNLPPSLESRLRERAEPTVKQLCSNLMDIFINCCAEHLTQQSQGSVTEPLNLTTENSRNASTITEAEQRNNNRADDLSSTTTIVVHPPAALPSQQLTPTNLLVDNVSHLFDSNHLHSNSPVDAHLDNQVESVGESQNISVPLLANITSQQTPPSPQTTVSNDVHSNIPIKEDLFNADGSTSLLCVESTSLHEPVTTENNPIAVSHLNSSTDLGGEADNDVPFEEIPSPPSVEEITYEQNISLAQPQEEIEHSDHETDENDDDCYEIIDQIVTDPATVNHQNITIESESDHECTEAINSLDDNENVLRNSKSSGRDKEEVIPAKRMKTSPATTSHESCEPANEIPRLPLLSICVGSIKTNVNSAFDIVVPHSETTVLSSVPSSGQNSSFLETPRKALKRQQSFPTALSSQQSIIEAQTSKPSTSKAKSSSSSHSPPNRSLSEASNGSCHSSRAHQPDSRPQRQPTKKIAANCSNETSNALITHGRPEVMKLIAELAPQESTSSELETRTQSNTDNDWYNASDRKCNDIITFEMKCHQPECNLTFTDKSSHAKHLFDSHRRLPYCCPSCNRTCPNMDVLRHHMNKEHPGNKCKCRLCPHIAKDCFKLFLHNVFWHEEGVYGCILCDFTGNLKGDVTNHISKKHPTIVQTHEKNIRRQSSIDGYADRRELKPKMIIIAVDCMICSKKFLTMTDLEEHNARVHQIKAYPCHVKDCYESFACKNELNFHVEAKHKPPFFCAYCLAPTNFATNLELCRHVLDLHQEGKFFCACCNYFEKTRISLRNHWNSSHLQKLIVVNLFCPMANCKDVFPFEPTETNYLKHLFEKHKIKKFKCFFPSCSSSFDSKNDIEDHVTVHNVKRWKCSNCVFTTPKHNSLHTHFRLTHLTGFFRCKYQGCQFTAKNRKLVYDHYDETHLELTVIEVFDTPGSSGNHSNR